MSEYKVTIKVTETYTYDADDARCQEDAIAEAFERRYLWFRKPDEEFSVIAELQELMEDE